MYVFVKVTPVTHIFEKVLSYTFDEKLVQEVQDLLQSYDVFEESLRRLSPSYIQDISDINKAVINEINNKIGADISWADELVIQHIQDAKELQPKFM